MHASSEKDWAEAVRKEAVVRPLAAGAKLGRASVQATAQALGLILEARSSSSASHPAAQLIQLRIGALVLGEDPGVADQPA